MTKLSMKIKTLRLSLGMEQRDLAAKIGGVDRSTVTKWETGKQEPKLEHANMLAVLAGQTLQEFLGLPTTIVQSGRRIDVIGEVQAGSWSDASQWGEEDGYQTHVLLPDRWASTPIFGLDVKGDSFNRVYPDGSIVYVVPIEHVPGGPKAGDVVVATRENDTGEYETTLKELDITPSGEKWLYPRSTSPEHQAPVALGTGRRGSKARVVITGVVVAALVYAKVG